MVSKSIEMVSITIEIVLKSIKKYQELSKICVACIINYNTGMHE